MSLINDALKRAGQTLKRNPAEPSPTIGLKAAEDGGASMGGPVKLLLVVLVVAVLGAGGWFIWKAVRPAKPKPPTAAREGKKTGVVELAKSLSGAKATGVQAKVTGTVQPNLKPVVLSNPPAPAVTSPEPAKPVEPTVGPAAQPSPSAKAEPTVAAPEKPAAPAPWPTLDLEGIFFRLKNPSARINGTNLYVGNEIEGARVVDIQRQQVKVEFGGETSVLTLKR
jgi:hypothetical protein